MNHANDEISMRGRTMEVTQRYHEALAYASALHARQERKVSGIPYIAHLLSVSALVWENGGDEEQAIAALLHDAVEDQGGLPRLDEIRQVFGDRVAAIVEVCTDATEIPKPPWRPRKEAHLAHLREVPEEALLVVAADKLHNARSVMIDHAAVGPVVWQRFTGRRDGTIWYYGAIHEVLYARIPGCPLVVELAEIVERMAVAT